MTLKTDLLLGATFSILYAMGASPSDECDVDLRLYSSASDCLGGFSVKHEALYSVIADGKCRDSGTKELGYYMATCDGGTNLFRLSRSGCTDNSCSDCANADAYSGIDKEGGCMVDWTVSDLDKAGSVPFSAVADGECHDSGIDGLGHYVADCQDDGYWFQFTKSGCTDALCGECTKVSKSEISPQRQGLTTLETSGVRPQCEVDAFYKEKVWSVSGSCQRPGCSGSIGSTLPVKWWPNTIDDGRSVECIYGNDYPEQYHVNDKLRDTMLFNSREKCCSAYARVTVCEPTPSPTILLEKILETTSTENGAISSEHSLGLSSFFVLFVVIAVVLS